MADLIVGLVGMGAMGRNHARVLQSLDGVELVGVADADPVTHGAGIHLESSVEDLIRDSLDYRVVAVPTEHHGSVGLKLAQAGVHALIEKPLAQNSTKAAELATAFEAHGLIGGVGHIERHNAALQQARARLENGDLGDIDQIATRRQGPFPTRITDVGVVMDLATRDFDLTTWVTQRAYETISAQSAHRSGRKNEDLISAVGRLVDGTVASHLVNWLSPLKERTIVVTGERGTFVVDTLASELTLHANARAHTTWDELANFRGVAQGDVTRLAFDRPEPLRTEHERFRDAVLGRTTDIVTMWQGLATVKVAEACLESAETGRTVLLNSLPGVRA